MTNIDLEIYEQENSNLRKHLLWCAQFLDLTQRKELMTKINHPIEQGGATDDLESDVRRDNLEKNKIIYSTIAHIDDAIKNGVSDVWFARAYHLAKNLKHCINDTSNLTFYELKNNNQKQ